MKTKLAQSFFLLSADPVSAFKFPARLPCPSKYVMDTSTNQCVLDTSTVFDWTCNADGTLTINNLHVDHFLEDYSSSAGAANGALNIFSQHNDTANKCKKATQGVSYTNFHLDSVTFAQSEFCASDVNFDASTGKTIIEYKITADYPVPGSLTAHSIIVGCSFDKKVKATFEPNFDSASVPAAGASGGSPDSSQTNFGAKILEMNSFKMTSGLKSKTADEPVAIGQDITFTIKLPDYLKGLSVKMRVNKCTATSKTPPLLTAPSKTFYERRCANPDGSEPGLDYIPMINNRYSDNANATNGWENTEADLTFKAFTIVNTDVKYGVKMDCDITICHTSDTDPACKYLC